MRTPFQVLIFPYIKERGEYYYAIFRRKDMNIWQGIAGGGEEKERPIGAAKREANEEALIDKKSKYIRLTALTTIPATNIHGLIWGKGIIMVPEFSFGVEVPSRKLKLSDEHTQCIWLNCKNALKRLKYDSNKSALWELDFRLKNKSFKDATENTQKLRRYL